MHVWRPSPGELWSWGAGAAFEDSADGGVNTGDQIWVTRSLPAGLSTGRRLKALGFEPLVAPVLRVEPAAASIDLAAGEAVALSSAHAAHRLAELTADRAVLILAVGDATAAAARDLGFCNVRSSTGDVRSLLGDILKADLKGPLVHVCGETVAGDLVGDLTRAGIAARRCVVYRTRAVETTPEPVAAALKAQRLSGVLIHSPAAGRIVRAHLEAEGEAARGVEIFGLSSACLAPFIDAGFPRVKAAERPNEASLLACLGAT